MTQIKNDSLSPQQQIADLKAQLAQREQELAAQRHATARMHALLHSMLDPCIIVAAVRDATGTIVDFRVEDANDLACDMTAYTQAEMLGRTLHELYPHEDISPLIAEYRRVVETGEPLRSANQVYETERNGVQLHMHFDLHVVKQGDGLIVTWRDVTTHSHTVVDLQRNQERLRLALEANHMGLWEWGFEGLPRWSREMCQLFGLPCEEESQVVSAKAILGAIHPDDYPETQHQIRQVLEQGSGYHQIFRVIHPDGTIRWIETQGHLVSDRLGHSRMLIGVATDITERKRLADELEKALGLLNGLFESAPVGLAVWDTDLRYQRINTALAVMNGITPADHIGRTVEEILPGVDDLAEIAQLQRRVLETGEPILNYEVVGSTPASDERRTWRDHFYPIYRQDEVIGVGAIVEEITALKRAAAEREQLVGELAAERAQLAELTEHLEEMVAERTHQVRHLANQLTVAEQEERARISQILHDHIQQMLYGIQMRTHLIDADLAGCQLDAADMAPLQENLDELNRLAHEAVTVARNLAIELNPPILDTDNIHSLIEWLAEYMHELHGLQTRLVFPQDAPLQLGDKNRRLLLLHSVRELLFNVVKHAGTRTAEVQISQEDGVLQVTVHDQGNGFDHTHINAPPNHTPSAPNASVPNASDRNSASNRSGLGLATLRERLRLYDGTLCIESTPRAGTTITILLPA